MSEAGWLAAIIVGSGLIALIGTRALIPALRRAAVLDRPNERSLHDAPIPRGGGIAVVAAIIVAWLAVILLGEAAPRLLAALAGALALAAISWRDDRGGLSPIVRLVVQVPAVALGLLALPPGGMVLQGLLPPALDAAAAVLLWLWFVNLFNFMDGIDGIAGSEAAMVAIGLLLLAAIGTGQDPGPAALAATLAAASVGFLIWNWAPARIFLGDVGSVPLGYLLGFLLLSAAARGFWKAALILPAYFLADATLTLLRRAARGEKVWRPHLQHFYQRAAQRGLGHAEIVWRVTAANLLLVACGWMAENGWGIAGLVAAAAVTAALLASLAGVPPFVGFFRPGPERK